MTTSKPSRPPPLLFTVEDVCERTQLGRTRIYQELKSGRLRSITLGKSRRIPVMELHRWIAERLEEGG